MVEITGPHRARPRDGGRFENLEGATAPPAPLHRELKEDFMQTFLRKQNATVHSSPQLWKRKV